MQMNSYRFLNFIILADVTIGLICIPTAGKLVDVFGTPLSVTIFYFPLVYVFSAVTTEVYGYAVARRLLWYTIAAQVVATIVFQFVIAVPPSAFLRKNQSYIDVLSAAPRLVLFGNLAIFLGDTVNNLVVAKMKAWCRGQYLPIRFVLSTLCGQLVDTSIFYIFALGTLPESMLTNSILLEVSISVAVSALCLPVSRAVASWLKRAEKLDVFDYTADFNPLRF
jgi:queuosine precursor transporter